MKLSDVYLEAANLIDEGSRHFACVAIDDVVGWGEVDGWSPATLKFQDLFEVGDDGINQFDCPHENPNSKLDRELALLFMAAVAAYEEKILAKVPARSAARKRLHIQLKYPYPQEFVTP